MTTPTPMPWGAESLWEQLEPLLPGISVEVVARSPSTNTALLERARVSVGSHGQLVQVRPSVESAAFGRRAADVMPCLLVAEHQTGGRGRMGRAWKAAPGASLTFSLSLPLDPPDWSGLSLAVGVALAEALDPPGRAGALHIGLKWPNDLWLVDANEANPARGRKLGGVLIETVSAGAQRLAVIGIGLNVLPLPLPANDLRSGYGCVQEIDAQASAPAVLRAVAAPLVQALLRFNREGFAPFEADFARRDLLAGHAVVTTQADVKDGIARGVSGNGALRVETPEGLREVSSGEVSVRLESSLPDTAPGVL